MLDCIKKMVPEFEVQPKILSELHLYKICGNHFGSKLAMAQRITYSPNKKLLQFDFFLNFNFTIHIQNSNVLVSKSCLVGIVAYWWRMFGSPTQNLQKLAIRILSCTCNALGCERNWSVFEQVCFLFNFDGQVLFGVYLRY